jgi:WD40 repeat protein
MESIISNIDNKYTFCEHLRNKYLNSFCSKNINDKINTTEIINKTNSFAYEQTKNIIDNFFIKNLNLDWTAIYNPQSLATNSINREGCIFTLSFNSDATHLASSNHNHNIEIWDIKNRKIKKIIKDHKEIVTGIEYFHNDKTRMMTCSLDKTIKLWENYENIYTFVEHSDWVRCLALSKNNKYFLSGCVSSVIKFWDLEERKVVHSISNVNSDPELLNTVNSLAFLNENDNLFISGLRSGNVKIYDIRNKNPVIKEFKAHKLKLNSVKINQNDMYLLSSGRDSMIRLWDFRKLPVILYKFRILIMLIKIVKLVLMNIRDTSALVITSKATSSERRSI